MKCQINFTLDCTVEVEVDNVEDAITIAENMYDDDYNFHVQFYNSDGDNFEIDMDTHIMRDDYDVKIISKND